MSNLVGILIVVSALSMITLCSVGVFAEYSLQPIVWEYR